MVRQASLNDVAHSAPSTDYAPNSGRTNYEDITVSVTGTADRPRGAAAVGDAGNQSGHDGVSHAHDGTAAQPRPGVRLYSRGEVQLQANGPAAHRRLYRAASRGRQLSLLQRVRRHEGDAVE